jgi:hypothetical protein
VSYELRHLERLPLGTFYPQVVERTREIVHRLPAGEWLLAVNQTGVGRPVVDLFEQADLQSVAITITGDDALQGEGRRLWVPQRDLVGVLTVAFQSSRLKIAQALPLANVLAKELSDFKVKTDAWAAHDTYGAWREGQHDDLVLSVALACWTAERWFSTPPEEIVILDDFRMISRY